MFGNQLGYALLPEMEFAATVHHGVLQPALLVSHSLALDMIRTTFITALMGVCLLTSLRAVTLAAHLGHSASLLVCHFWAI